MFLETGSQVAQVGLELLILLPPPLKFRDYIDLYYAAYLMCEDNLCIATEKSVSPARK